MSKSYDLNGQKINKLTVLGRAPKKGKSKQLFWKCRCDCGTIVTIASWDLRKNQLSCGCVKIKTLTTHGKSKSPEYRIWAGMIQRCTNVKKTEYPYYGGRGITVCDTWLHDFKQFYKDMGKRPSIEHSLDRIDPNGNYEKKNCKWATPLEQWVNKRKPGTHFTFNGYQRRASKTAIYKDRKELMGLIYCSLGLVSEAGEVAGKVKKMLRSGFIEVDTDFKKEIMLEAGDTLWYLSQLADELGVTLDQIAKLNINKLEDRMKRGKISGSGDHR